MNTTTQSWMSAFVSARRMETDEIVLIELISTSGDPMPPFSAGSHIDVDVGRGLIRQYSLCNNPTDLSKYQIAILKDPNSRGGSLAMHNIAADTKINISNPKNHFELDHSASHSILFAGGIGITPILCMAERLSNLEASFDLHYSSRSASRTAFKAHMAGSRFSARVQFYHDDGPENQRLDLKAALGVAAKGTHVYVCGPGGFIDAVLNAARAAGYENSTLHREHFAPAAADAQQSDGAFKVKLASSGRILEVAADRTVVETLYDEGIDIPLSCEQGVCGTCVTRILDGVPDHRDVFLTEEEKAANDKFTPCCSRALSSMLVLDL